MIPENTKTGYTTANQNQPKPTAQWRAPLQARGIITDATIDRAGIQPNGTGWLYSFRAGDTTYQRWKAYPGQQGAKYKWYKNGKPGNMPQDARFYDPAGDLADHIAAAHGVLILATGEADVWACWEAGLFNVTCTMMGEGTISPWLLSELTRLSVSEVRYYPDRDQPGYNAAVKLNGVFSEITFRAYELPYEIGSKADLNRLLIDSGPAGFLAAMAACPVIDLPKLQPPAEHKTTYEPPADFAGLYEQWCIEVERAAVAAWNIAPPNGKNLSRKNFSSPLRDDRHPSAQWNYTTHGFTDYAEGEFHNTKQVAELLGVQSWEDYKAEHAPAVEKSHSYRQLSGGKRRKATLEETIKPVDLPDFQAHQAVTMRYISDLPVGDVLAHRAVLIKSPVGTGKTELASRVIAKLDQRGTANVLVITHRQALAADIAARLGLECYKTIPDSMLSQAHRLVITYNSLHKIGTGRAWDLVVIDEIEQFHQHLFSDTFRGGEAYRAAQALTSVLQHTSHFMGLDAHLTGISAQWAHRITQHTPYIIQNTYRRDWGDLVMHASESTVIAAALEAVQESRGPVVIPTSSRKRSEMYYRMVCDTIGPDGVLLVNGENSGSIEVQHFIDHINQDLPKLRVLICTPSFGTGLDVTAPVYGVFGIMFNRPLIATDMIQMLGRFRNAEQRHVYVQPLHQEEPGDWTDRYGDALDAAAETRQLADFAQHSIEPIPAGQHHVLLLAAQLEGRADRQKTDLASYFAAYATAEGFKLSYRNGQDAPTRDAIRATAKTLADERKNRVLTAEPVDHADYELHQQDGTMTPEIIAGHERWKIENTVGLDITGLLYDDLHNPAKRRALRRLADVLTDRERLKSRDRAEATEQVLLSQRGHYTTTHDLIVGGVSAVFGTDFLTARAELTEAQIITLLSPWLAEHMKQVNRMVGSRQGLSQAPMFVLRRLLDAIGLKLARRQIMRDGQRFMMYSLDQETGDRWVSYAHARLAHLARLEAITTNRREERPYTVCSNEARAARPPDKTTGDLWGLLSDIVRGRPGTAPQGAW